MSLRARKEWSLTPPNEKSCLELSVSLPRALTFLKDGSLARRFVLLFLLFEACPSYQVKRMTSQRIARL